MQNTEEYFNSKKFKTILKEFEDNEKAGIPSIISSEDYVDISEFFYNNGAIEHALEVIDTAMKLYPGATGPLLFMARYELLDNDDPIKATEYAERIEDKTDVEYFYLTAELMLVQDKAAEADAYLEEHYSAIDDEDREYYEIDTASLFVDYDELELAEKWFKRCSDQEIIEYKELKARLMLNRGEFETSKKLYKELLDNDPYSTTYWNSLASSQFFSNDIEESINSSEYSIAIDPNNTLALLNKANGLYNLGNYGEALKYYKRYNALCPEDESGEMLIGLCYLLLDDFENAIIHLGNAERMSWHDSPNLLDIHKDMAYALCRLDRIDEGMAELDKTEHIDCDHDEILAYRGSLLLASGRFSESKDYFIQALRNTDYRPDIMLKICITIYESGDLKLAHRMFKLLYSINKDWHEGYAYFAACCHDLGRNQEFLKYLKPAVEYSPDEAKDVLGVLFPEDMNPAEYYGYVRKILNKSRGHTN